MDRRKFALSLPVAVLIGALAPPTAPAQEAPPTMFVMQSYTGAEWGLGAGADVAGDLFVVDGGQARLLVFDGSLTLLSTWGGRGTATGPLPNPVDVAVAPTGNVYVLGGAIVQRYSPSRTLLASFGQAQSGAGALVSARAIALDMFGDVYVADPGARLVQRYRADGTWVIDWPLPPQPYPGVPIGLDVDRSERVYVVDGVNLWVQVFSSAGARLNGWSVSGRMRSAGGAELDEFGGLYLADPAGQQIVKYRTDGTYLAAWPCGNLGGGGARTNDVVVGTFGRIYGVVSTTTGGRIEGFQYAATPATRSSWGALKGRYRGGDPPAGSPPRAASSPRRSATPGRPAR